MYSFLNLSLYIITKTLIQLFDSSIRSILFNGIEVFHDIDISESLHLKFLYISSEY